MQHSSSSSRRSSHNFTEEIFSVQLEEKKAGLDIISFPSIYFYRRLHLVIILFAKSLEIFSSFSPPYQFSVDNFTSDWTLHETGLKLFFRSNYTFISAILATPQYCSDVYRVVLILRFNFEVSSSNIFELHLNASN